MAVARMALEASLRGERRETVAELAAAAARGADPRTERERHALSELLGPALLFVDELERCLEISRRRVGRQGLGRGLASVGAVPPGTCDRRIGGRADGAHSRWRSRCGEHRRAAQLDRGVPACARSGRRSRGSSAAPRGGRLLGSARATAAVREPGSAATRADASGRSAAGRARGRSPLAFGDWPAASGHPRVALHGCARPGGARRQRVGETHGPEGAGAGPEHGRAARRYPRAAGAWARRDGQSGARLAARGGRDRRIPPDSARVCDRADRPRRRSAQSEQASGGACAAPAGARAVRRTGDDRARRASSRGARSERRANAPGGVDRDRLADPERAPGRGDGRPRPDDPADRNLAVRDREDGRVSPAARVQQDERSLFTPGADPGDRTNSFGRRRP